MAALEQWPAEGVPRNPGAWLMTVAKRRAIDTFRRNRELEKRYAQLARDAGGRGESATRTSTAPSPTTSTTTCCG